jgi:hypothetical protein
MIFYSTKNSWRINVLEGLNGKIDEIRALQGHSGPIRESLAGSRVLVTEKHATMLFHGTEYACVEGIKKNGLLRGGTKNSGRKEIYCCITDPRDRRNKAPCGRFPLEPWITPKIMPYDIKNKAYLVIIDTLAAIYSGVTWTQTESFAVLGGARTCHDAVFSL